MKYIITLYTLSILNKYIATSALITIVGVKKFAAGKCDVKMQNLCSFCPNYIENNASLFISSFLLFIKRMSSLKPALGFKSFVVIIGVLGPFAATQLEANNTTKEPYFYSRIVVGVGYAMCTLLALIIKFRINSKPFAKV